LTLSFKDVQTLVSILITSFCCTQERRKAGLTCEAGVHPNNKFGVNHFNGIIRSLAIKCDFANKDTHTLRSARRLMLAKMKKVINQSEISAASVLNSGRHKSIDASILCQDEDDTDHLARNECLHHNPNNKRGSDSGLGFIRPIQKQRASEGEVQGVAAIVPMVPQVATAAVPQASVPMMPQSATVPQVSAAPGSDFDSMMPMLQLMMMQKMMQVMGGDQQPMVAPMQHPMAAQVQQPLVALVQQPTMAPVQDGGMAPVQNGANAAGAEDAYPIIFPTQQFEDQVGDSGNGNGDEDDDCFDEDEIDMGDDCGGDDDDEDDE